MFIRRALFPLVLVGCAACAFIPGRPARPHVGGPLPVVVLPGIGQRASDVTDTPILRMVARRVFTEVGGAIAEVSSTEPYTGRLDIFVADPIDALGDIERNARHEAEQISRFLAFHRIERRGEGGAPVLERYALVGVSMGGVIARQMLMSNAAELGGRLPARLVLVCAPNHGADGQLFANTAVPIPPLSRATVALTPASYLLKGLNAQTVPAAVQVHTLACEASVQTRVRPHASDRVWISEALNLYNDVPCTHAHVDGPRVGIGSDGLVRVQSARLLDGEAATIASQQVVQGVWHSPWFRNAANSEPREKHFIDARGASAGGVVSASVYGINGSDDVIESSAAVANALLSILEAP